MNVKAINSNFLSTMAGLQQSAHKLAPQVVLFDEVEDAFNAMFGPQQHDAHMRPWRWRKFCKETYGIDIDKGRP